MTKTPKTCSTYIVLTRTGTFMSHTIRLIGSQKWTHVSFAPDGNLDHMFSFARRGRYNMLNSGFIRESLKSGMFALCRKGDCCVIEVNGINEAKYKRVKRKLDMFMKNAASYNYNIAGLFTMIFGRGFKRKNHYFCSQFVSELLNEMGVWERRPEKTRPSDFLHIPNSRVVFSGTIEQAAIAYKLFRDDEEVLFKFK